MATTYMPSGENDLVPWLNNFKTKLVTQFGALLGFTTSELTQLGNETQAFGNAVQYKNALRTSEGAMTSMVREMRTGSPLENIGPVPVPPAIFTIPPGTMKGLIKKVQQYVQRIKSHPAYTTTIGQELGIIAPVQAFNPATMQPELKVRVDAGYAKLSWKRKQADGVVIYVDRGDGNGFVELARRVSTSYIDAEPMPANTISVTRTYKLRYFINDDEVGVESVSVTVNVIRV